MAPARMISFIEKHAGSCDICQQDPDLQDEIAKITELILPESKIPKAVRQKTSMDDDIDPEDETDDEVEEDTEEEETDDSLDEDDGELDLDDDLSDETEEI